MYEFNVGDRVVSIVNNPEGNEYIFVGSTGTVRHIDTRLAVCWDDNVGGHNCRGLCPNGHGWWVDMDDVELDDGANDEPFEFDEDEFNKLIHRQ